MTSELIAQFNTACPWCFHDIEAGEDTAPVDGVWYHGECSDELWDLRD